MKKNENLYTSIYSSLESGIPGVLITSMNQDNQKDNIKFFINKNQLVIGDSIEDKKMTQALKKYIAVEIASRIFSSVSTIRLNKETLEIQEYKKNDLVSNMSKHKDKFFLLEYIYPKLKLVIVGAGHVGQALAQIAEIIGFEIFIIDDRKDYANEIRFPMAKGIFNQDLALSINSINLDSLSYVVLVSRGHKLDEEALRTVIDKNSQYIGMIGSKRRTSIVLNSLLNDGISAKKLQAVHTPVGLNLGGQSPGEIALAILAEIIQVIHKGDGKSLRLSRKSLL
ncbi:MAG: XdhC family protein [Dehalococcoidia bacterium]|nr:XdhC family protein [Dehalococcoidia bacterium]